MATQAGPEAKRPYNPEPTEAVPEMKPLLNPTPGCSSQVEPEPKRQRNALVTLLPLKGSANLRERYTVHAADVFFVEKHTKERLPAHRQVLSVASAVFFEMFDGDCNEKSKKEIPAPAWYNWESFKAAIALLYGEEVEVEESSITDIYRVAHRYDLRAVISAFAQTIQVWDLQQLSTVVELCALAGQVEAEQKQVENELIRAAVRYIAQHLEQIRETSVDIAGLSYQTMLMLVQCEVIVSSEQDVLTTLNQWVDANRRISLKQAQELFSHIRYGTLPYESLVLCRVGQTNLDMTLGNHKKLSVVTLRTNLAQITPRVGQKEVLQVYPLAPGLTETMQEGRHKFTNISTAPAVALVFSGRQDFTFEVALHFTVQNALTAASLFCGLYSVTDTEQKSRTEIQLRESDSVLFLNSVIIFSRAVVTLGADGSHLMLYSDRQCNGVNVSKAVNIPFSGPFPWLMTFGLHNASSRYSLMFKHPIF